jgi:hypothetical protein
MQAKEGKKVNRYVHRAGLGFEDTQAGGDNKRKQPKAVKKTAWMAQMKPKRTKGEDDDSGIKDLHEEDAIIHVARPNLVIDESKDGLFKLKQKPIRKEPKVKNIPKASDN